VQLCDTPEDGFLEAETYVGVLNVLKKPNFFLNKVHLVGDKTLISQNICPHAVHKVPLHGRKTGVWCAASARKVIRSLFFEETIDNSPTMLS
jgi:hypothetical protein